MDWQEKLDIYKTLVSKCEGLVLKGKTMPYTSANGHMFSLLNKAGELGFRYSEKDQKKYLKEWDTNIFTSYGATMKGYVLIPDEMLMDLDQLSEYLMESHKYVMSLDPK